MKVCLPTSQEPHETSISRLAYLQLLQSSVQRWMMDSVLIRALWDDGFNLNKSFKLCGCVWNPSEPRCLTRYSTWTISQWLKSSQHPVKLAHQDGITGFRWPVFSFYLYQIFMAWRLYLSASVKINFPPLTNINIRASSLRSPSLFYVLRSFSLFSAAMERENKNGYHCSQCQALII